MEAQVLFGRQVSVQCRLLEHEADIASHGVAFRHDIVARHLREAFTHLGESAEHIDGGRLPGSVWTKKAENLALKNVEIDTAHRFEILEAFLQAAEVDRRRQIHLNGRANRIDSAHAETS